MKNNIPRGRLSTRAWVILFGLSLIMLALAAQIQRGASRGKIACVYVDGELERTIDLAGRESFSFTVEGVGGSNLVEVQPGRIRIAQADCPDQTCVRQGWLEDGTPPIVCLPNRIVIQIEDPAADAPFDAVTG